MLTEANPHLQKRWQNEKFGVDMPDDYEDENLYEVGTWALDGMVLKSGPVYREGGLQWELWG